MIPSSPVSCRLSITTVAVTKETPTIYGKNATILFLSTMLSRGSANIFGKFSSLPHLHSDVGRAATTAGAVISIYGTSGIFLIQMKKIASFQNFLR